MSYSTLPAPSDIFGVNSGLRSRVFPMATDRRSDDSHSPTSEPRSPHYRPALQPAELPPHLVSLYNSPYAAAAVAAAMAGQGSGGATTSGSHFGHFGRVPNSFYPVMVGGEAWRRPPYLSQLDMYWPGLRSLEAVVGPRTKAPREATSILKSWLNDHKDNPYPTKSEKMTLSIVTHMTLTQVSTWFANARRRIKKENKMTWTPKTRSGERDDNSSNDEDHDRDYYGRQRSPFSVSRDSTDASLPSFDGCRRPLIHPVSNTIPKCLSSPMPPPNTAHALFSGFNGFTAERRMINENIAASAAEKKFPHGRPAANNGNATNQTKVTTDAKACRSKSHDSDDEKDAARAPLIHLGERTSQTEDDCAFQTNANPDIRLSPSQSRENSPRGSECTPSPRVKIEHEEESPCSAPSAHSPVTRDRKADAITSWMKDFQHLVATGQEDRARQALAAFALAAKAGTYPDLRANAFEAYRGTDNGDRADRQSAFRNLSLFNNPYNTRIDAGDRQKRRLSDGNCRRNSRAESDSSDAESKSSIPDFHTRKRSLEISVARPEASGDISHQKTILRTQFASGENSNYKD